jgi:fructokinase
MSRSINVVGLGEALWDVLPNGKVLGGAPLNVACHAHRLLRGRGEGIVASRVGTDLMGDEVLADLARRGMTTKFVQRDPAHPTSTVTVELHAGQPTYTFAADIAWDHLEPTKELLELATECDALCFGTLAQRSRKSRETIWSVLDAAYGALLLFDVNLRQGFYDRESVEGGCRRATFVKLNEHELPIVSDLLELPPGSLQERLMRFFDRFDVKGIVLTRGERGTLIVMPDGVFDSPPVSYPTAANADAVGAGDACSAAVLVGLVLDWPMERTVALANHMGAYVASQPGATPDLPMTIAAMIE